MENFKETTRVLIVDDSVFIRKVLLDIFLEDPEIEVVGVAKNGQEALEIARLTDPDVITLDVEMPIMDGLSCLKALLNIKPYAVVMISSATDEGTKATIDALAYGAIDFIKKPKNLFSISNDEKKKEIIQKVKVAKNAALKNISKKADIMKKQYIGKKAHAIENIVVIGTSTGGPRALQSVIPFLPGNIPAAVVIVQHMPQGFTHSLAARLNEMSEIIVKEAEDMEILTAGVAYIAQGDRHLILETVHSDYRFRLDASEPVFGLRPCFDNLLYSMAKIEVPDLIGVVMTGMGGDGSKGLKELKEKRNIQIIAQDEKTCVVYGMPRVVTEMGIVDKIVPLQKIPEAILNYMGVQR